MRALQLCPDSEATLEVMSQLGCWGEHSLLRCFQDAIRAVWAAEGKAVPVNFARQETHWRRIGRRVLVVSRIAHEFFLGHPFLCCRIPLYPFEPTPLAFQDTSPPPSLKPQPHLFPAAMPSPLPSSLSTMSGCMWMSSLSTAVTFLSNLLLQAVRPVPRRHKDCCHAQLCQLHVCSLHSL